MVNWDIVAGLYNTSLTLFFFLLAFLMFFIAAKGYKSKNRYGGSSTVLSGILFLIFGYYTSIFGFMPYPYTGFMLWWIGIILGINLGFALTIRKIIRKMEAESPSENEKVSLLKQYVLLMTKENPYKDSISFKMEGIRKSFHLAGFLFVFSYFWFFLPIGIAAHVNNNVIVYINDTEWLYNIMWGDVNEQYPYYLGDPQAVIDLTLFALIAALVLACMSDLIRVLWGPEYSIFNFLTRAVLRNKELNAAGPQIYLLCGVIFAYMFFIMGLVHILVLTTGILVACFSDALAALIGRKYGKHKVTCIGGDIKSVEGFIAGSGSAFLISFIILANPIYAIIGAIIFFLLDYFPIILADNILNPIAITLGIGIAMALMGLPIGWL